MKTEPEKRSSLAEHCVQLDSTIEQLEVLNMTINVYHVITLSKLGEIIKNASIKDDFGVVRIDTDYLTSEVYEQDYVLVTEDGKFVEVCDPSSKSFPFDLKEVKELV